MGQDDDGGELGRVRHETGGLLSLDSHDNDPVVFWSHLLAAVRSTGEVEGTSLSGLTINAPLGQDLLRRIGLGVAELSRSLTLVLDDLSEVGNTEVLTGIAALLRHPSPLRLVAISRLDSRLPLHRLRVEGALTEVRASDLAFTATEADQLLHLAGVHLPPDVSQRLLERTEGWAVGLRLAALFAARRGQGARIEEFAGDESSVAGYLAEEVLADLPAQRRRFLLLTSVADRLCAELADALCDQSGGQRELEALEHAYTFVVALGAGHPCLSG